MKKIDYATYKKPSDYIKFDQGNNLIRVISSGGIGMFHAIRSTSGYAPLGFCTEDGNCPHCEKNDPKRVWRWIVWDVKRNEVKMLDAGPMIGNAICELAHNLKKDPQEFDLIINRVGEKLRTKYRVSKASTTTEITEEKLKELKPMKRYLIKKYFG